jgi:autophagy-related protein 9
MSYPFASRYVEQFPKIKMVQVARFIAFIAGAIVSVLALATVIDPELFLSFEITTNRTVIFYLGIFGTIWAVSHGTIPDDNVVFDPEYALLNVIDYTHYKPASWKDRLHSDEVKREFSELYQMKVVIFVEELFSIILTPFILWFSLPQCSDRIIDFFREFTIHVDGLGYVCSFAVFDFKKGFGNVAGKDATNETDGLRDDYYSTKHGKMAASYYGFLDNATRSHTAIPANSCPSFTHAFHALGPTPSTFHDRLWWWSEHACSAQLSLETLCSEGHY